MTRWSLILTLAVLLCGLAAAQQTVVTNSGFATTPGPALSNATPTVTVPIAPQVSFVNRSASPVGATNATGGNVAGATNATIGNVPGVSNASIGVPVFATTQFTPNANLVAEEQLGPPAPGAAANTGMATAGVVPVAIFNTGVAQFNSAYNASAASEPDIVQVAAANRQKGQQAQLRTYTNDDIRRLNETTGVTTAAISPAPAGAPSSTAPAATAGVAGTTQSAGASGSSGPASPFAPKAAIGGSAGATSPGSSAGSIATEQSATGSSAEAGTEAGTQSATPSEQNATGAASQPQGGLPATATPLPLYAALGIAAAAAGLFYFRFRQRAVSPTR